MLHADIQQKESGEIHIRGQGEDNKMKLPGVMIQPQWLWEICPYCHKSLGKVATLKRRIRKFCRCRYCKKVVDERFVVW